MSINISITQNTELKPKLVVFGVGGAGGNAINNMVKANLEGVDFWVANTDAQALNHSAVPAERRIQLGATSTRGLGAGSHPDVGGKAAEESLAELQEILESANMCFITAGMGGGTGTGAAPVIARLAREMGILTVGVVTKPFHFEGARRMRVAEIGLTEMQKHVDTLIVIPNQNLFRIANEKTTFAQAFGMADEVLNSGVRSITDLITLPGIVNLDFADIRTIMFQSGKAMMGTGEADGEKRSIKAAENAISNPLLDISSMKGAKGVLINISGGMDMTLYELDEAANRIKEEVDPEANIIVGSAFNDLLDGKIRVSVVATGIEQEARSEFANSHMAIEPKKPVANVMFQEPEAQATNDAEGRDAEEKEETSPSTVQFPIFRQERGLFDDEEGLLHEHNKLELEVSNDDVILSERAERPEIEDKKTDIFDIPAFLRRKIRKK